VTTDFLNAQLPIAAATTAGQYLRTLTAGSHHFVSPLCNLHLFGIGATGHIQNVRGSYARNRLLHYYTVDSFDILFSRKVRRTALALLLLYYFSKNSTDTFKLLSQATPKFQTALALLLLF
jgi:hypothetical protein